MGDNLKGGKGDNTDAKNLDKDELAVGIEVEMEHTENRELAAEIAIDHLEEVPNYYTRLVKSGLVDEKPALDLYKKLFDDDPSKYVKESINNQLTPMNVNGMGEVTLPGNSGDSTEFSSQETGSGDLGMPKKKKKKKKKMLYIDNYDKFSANKNR